MLIRFKKVLKMLKGIVKVDCVDVKHDFTLLEILESYYQCKSPINVNVKIGRKKNVYLSYKCIELNKTMYKMEEVFKTVFNRNKKYAHNSHAKFIRAVKNKGYYGSIDNSGNIQTGTRIKEGFKPLHWEIITK